MLRLLTAALAMALVTGSAHALDDYEQLPPGSYYQTCQHCSYADGVLVCQCRTVDQNLNLTMLGYRHQCPGRTVQNIDGFLTCD